MTIEQFDKEPMSPTIAYIVGMILPLYKEKSLGATTYIVGSVNHNPSPRSEILESPNTSLSDISEAEIGQHFKIINNLLNGLEVRILANRNDYGSISSKKGFSILIEKGTKTSDECKLILKKRLAEISNSSGEIKCNFIKGCFDGRSSIDCNKDRKIIRYFSVDVDRDHQLQDNISEIADSIGISLNLNRRDIEHRKNDQIRIKQEAFLLYEEKVGFFSPFRGRQLSNANKNRLCK